MSERSSRRLPAAAVGLAAAIVIAGCAGGGEQPRVDVDPRILLPDSVPLGEPLDMGYEWAPGPDFTAPAEDYQVFVHLVDPQGEIALQDDHYPPEPTSQWRAGGSQQYRRWVYLPEDLEVEYLDVVVGLFSADGRAEVHSGDSWTDAPAVHRLAIRADDKTGMPVYMDGWHAPEQNPEGGQPWRWSKDVAHALFANPARDAVLHLRAHGPYDEVGPQTVTLRIGDTEVATIQIDASDPFLERIAIPATVLGDSEWAELTFTVAPAYVPQQQDPTSQDDRVLGIQVFHMYLSSS